MCVCVCTLLSLCIENCAQRHFLCKGFEKIHTQHHENYLKKFVAWVSLIARCFLSLCRELCTGKTFALRYIHGFLDCRCVLCVCVCVVQLCAKIFCAKHHENFCNELRRWYIECPTPLCPRRTRDTREMTLWFSKLQRYPISVTRTCCLLL